VKQPYDAFLVLDVEATCAQGTDLNWPNEIIVSNFNIRFVHIRESSLYFLYLQEFPVCLLRWKDKSAGGGASQLEVVDEFRSFVRPTWKPQLSDFCTTLTGITQVSNRLSVFLSGHVIITSMQSQVENAPQFPEVLEMLSAFLVKHGLINPHSGDRLCRFCWCSDGPFDVRDFVVKQCHISHVCRYFRSLSPTLLTLLLGSDAKLVER
jgi:3'-5' exoribonuclease 1